MSPQLQDGKGPRSEQVPISSNHFWHCNFCPRSAQRQRRRRDSYVPCGLDDDGDDFLTHPLTMSLFSQRLWESGRQSLRQSHCNRRRQRRRLFPIHFFVGSLRGKLSERKIGPRGGGGRDGERRRREKGREEKQQRRQQMGGIEEEDGTLPFACCWRPFCSVTPPPPPEAGQNGLCNYVWHGGGRRGSH